MSRKDTPGPRRYTRRRVTRTAVISTIICILAASLGQWIDDIVERTSSRMKYDDQRFNP